MKFVQALFCKEALIECAARDEGVTLVSFRTMLKPWEAGDDSDPSYGIGKKFYGSCAALEHDLNKVILEHVGLLGV